jgi:SAM-dependent methyltransferase
MMGTRINVGCGWSPTAGWLNFDNSIIVLFAGWPILERLASRLGFVTDRDFVDDFVGIARRYGIRHAKATALPRPDNSVEVVYSSHMIEHLDRYEAKRFLSEAFRVLKPGGILRLAAPDFRLLVEHYLNTGDADETMERAFLGRSRPRGWRARIRYLLIGERDHMWMYDGPSLLRIVESVGFVDAKILEAGTTTIEEPGSLNLSERSEESVYVEARKP